MGYLHNLRFLLIDRDPKFPAYPPDLRQAMLQVFLTLVNQIPVIHMPAIASDPQYLFHIVIETVCRGQGECLTDLTSKSQADITEHVNEMICDAYDPFIGELFSHDLLAQFMGDVIKEFGKIKKQDITFCTMFPVMLLQVSHHPPYGEMISTVFQ